MTDWPETLPEMAEYMRVSQRTFTDRLNALQVRFLDQVFFVPISHRKKLFYSEHHDLLKEYLPQLSKRSSTSRFGASSSAPSPAREYTKALKLARERRRKLSKRNAKPRSGKVVSLDNKRK